MHRTSPQASYFLSSASHLCLPQLFEDIYHGNETLLLLTSIQTLVFSSKGLFIQPFCPRLQSKDVPKIMYSITIC